MNVPWDGAGPELNSHSRVTLGLFGKRSPLYSFNWCWLRSLLAPSVWTTARGAEDIWLRPAAKAMVVLGAEHLRGSRQVPLCRLSLRDIYPLVKLMKIAGQLVGQLFDTKEYTG